LNHRGTETQRDPLTRQVIGLAIEVHRQLGPGLLESIYESCLCYELDQAGLKYARQVHLPVCYKGLKFDEGLRIDILIEDRLVIELKTVEKTLPVHEAQLLSYMKLGKHPVGLLINFNVPVLKEGIKRFLL